ncbi:hypothetical protein ANOM_010756 [Aspergillus nomiae NRRL 13137]|uniref:Uncharacterized protein n=1 Tax=Aspergillus nomiae NRRL (strain ATCC 15546 / NRRL 13137 / CBS 260.88 / M93) TaxID=1509407 RepID=A0A0L1IP60_ASPN3|nr:uncharacterized protein ANOM_010756 [Aspergillus nomiae NRRL 13137]KNG81322.1 hypothetical protein ANOM_010756 [Aspergillus nomiae NRRL 13137]
MPSATGALSANFNNFTGKWNVEGYEAELHGNFSQSVENWQSDATLEYDNVQDLVGTFSVQSGPSYVGVLDISLTLTNQAGKQIKITGPLSSPISQRTPIAGQGSWSIRM